MSSIFSYTPKTAVQASGHGQSPASRLVEQCHQAVGKQAMPEFVGMVDIVLHQGQVRYALTPEPPVARRCISQRHVVFLRKFAEAGHIRARIVVNVPLSGESHPVGNHVVGRQNRPLGADGLEIGQQLAVPLLDLRRLVPHRSQTPKQSSPVSDPGPFPGSCVHCRAVRPDNCPCYARPRPRLQARCSRPDT